MGRSSPVLYMCGVPIFVGEHKEAKAGATPLELDCHCRSTLSHASTFMVNQPFSKMPMPGLYQIVNGWIQWALHQPICLTGISASSIFRSPELTMSLHPFDGFVHHCEPSGSFEPLEVEGEVEVIEMPDPVVCFYVRVWEERVCLDHDFVITFSMNQHPSCVACPGQ